MADAFVLSTAVKRSSESQTDAARCDLSRSPWHDVEERLRRGGIRPTQQRMALCLLLFENGGRHVTAEQLYGEATKASIPVSLATVYNTLHRLTKAGLLREVAVDGSRTYFCTNASEHHHFFIEDENRLVDIPQAELIINATTTLPEGYEIVRADVVVRLKRARD